MEVRSLLKWALIRFFRMTSQIRNVIQQYGGIVESLAQTFLSFAPLTTGPEDYEADRSIQFMQSITDLVALRHDKFVKHGASRTDVCKIMNSVSIF